MQIAKLWTNLTAAVRTRSVKKQLSAPKNDEKQHSIAYAVAAFLFSRHKVAFALIVVQLLMCGCAIFFERHSAQNSKQALDILQRATAISDRALNTYQRSAQISKQALDTYHHATVISQRAQTDADMARTNVNRARKLINHAKKLNEEARRSCFGIGDLPVVTRPVSFTPGATKVFP